MQASCVSIQTPLDLGSVKLSVPSPTVASCGGCAATPANSPTWEPGSCPPSSCAAGGDFSGADHDTDKVRLRNYIGGWRRHTSSCSPRRGSGTTLLSSTRRYHELPIIRALEGSFMPTCETCGNDYDKTFDVVMSGKSHTFDSFECAIHALAPTCKHCGTRIVGHGLGKDDAFYCCDHCAVKDGVSGLRDRA
jgi:hypothetical protein